MTARFRDVLEACGEGDKEEVEKFIKMWDNVNKKDIHGRTFIHQAAFFGQTDIVKLVLDHGANIEEKNSEGESPIHRAAGEGHLDTVKLLLDLGAKVHEKDNDGRTPIYRAKMNGHTDTVKLLLDHGAKMPSLKNIHEACLAGYTEEVERFIITGVNKSEKNPKKIRNIFCFFLNIFEQCPGGMRGALE